jgi:hypothetical protein
MRQVVLLVPILTLVLGACVALSFLLIGGPVATHGPAVVGQSWPAIYGLQAAMVGVLMLGLGRWWRGRLTGGALVTAVVGAWLGQWLVLASGVLADELNPLNATGYWLLGTGGPLQPAVAIGAGLLGLRIRASRSRTTTAATLDGQNTQP